MAGFIQIQYYYYTEKHPWILVLYQYWKTRLPGIHIVYLVIRVHTWYKYQVCVSLKKLQDTWYMYILSVCIQHEYSVQKKILRDRLLFGFVCGSRFLSTHIFSIIIVQYFKYYLIGFLFNHDWFLLFIPNTITCSWHTSCKYQ
jgi:hypothetical protein